MRLRSMQHIKNELEQLYQDIYKMNIEEFVIEINTGLYSIIDLGRLLIKITNTKDVNVKTFKIDFLRHKMNNYKKLKKFIQERR